MKTFIKACALALALIPALAIANTEPEIFKAGDPRVSGLNIKPYNNAWIYSATLPDASEHVQGL